MLSMALPSMVISPVMIWFPVVFTVALSRDDKLAETIDTLVDRSATDVSSEAISTPLTEPREEEHATCHV